MVQRLLGTMGGGPDTLRLQKRMAETAKIMENERL